MRDPAIPFLRGLACLAVIFSHQIMNYTGCHGYQIGSPLFLLASGYCIHANYKDRANLDIFGFVFGRLKKLYPQYVLFLTFMLIVNHDVVQYLLHLTFLQNIHTQNDTQWLWTIAVIVQLYFLYPLIRKIPIHILLPCAAVIETAYRAVIQVNHLAVGLYALPFAYVFSWALGIALASKQHEPSWGFNFITSAILSILCVRIGAGSMQYTLAAITEYFILYWVIRLPREYFTNWVSRLGQMSYPIYLWHMPVIYAVFVATNGSLWSFPIGVIASLLVGGLMNEILKRNPSRLYPVKKLECSA